MASNYELAVKILKENNQEDIITILDNVNEDYKNNLINQILNFDFNKINNLYKKVNSKNKILDEQIENLEYTDSSKLLNDEKNEYIKLGEDVIKNNHYAVVTMAGGQGTRLGHKGPKGTFLLNVKPEPKYLFQILAENLIRNNKKYNITIPWYIMTSTENNDETIRFFEEHNYFGYPKDYIKFFTQGNLPLVFTNGKLIIGKEFQIKEASDGNGCIYKSMKEKKILEDMRKRDISWIFIGAVDNALLNMCDPMLIGLTIKQKNQIASKSVAKKDSTERVGVFCKIDKAPSVIEYSELPKEMSELRDKNGELLFGEAHIMCNLFSIDALEKIADKNLAYHVANKKANYIDNNCNYIETTTPNAYKFEAFIFDAFNFFDNITILRGKREENFAPVKNKQGEDSPDTAINLYNNYWKNN